MDLNSYIFTILYAFLIYHRSALKQMIKERKFLSVH